MIKRNKFFVVLIICILSLSSISLANMPNNIPNEINKIPESTNQIAVMSETTVAPNKDFYLILNLSNISFTKFKVDITNTSSLSANEVTTKVSELSINSVVTSFEVNKNSINLDKLGIVYTAPKENSVIKFDVKITSLDETKIELEEKYKTSQSELETLKGNLEKLNETLEKLKNDFETAKTEGLDVESEIYKEFETSIKNAEESILKIKSEIETKEKESVELKNKIDNYKEEILSTELEIEVTNTKQEQNMFDKNEAFNKENMLMMEEKNKEMTLSMKDMMNKMGNLELNLKDANNTISSLTKSTTYQGSQNNYLKSLEIDGVTFNNAYKKTTLTYFAKLEKDVSKVTVKAVPEDSSAVVTIYGNTDLKKGKNKIIVNVTADDGSIKTYKIYLTK